MSRFFYSRENRPGASRELSLTMPGIKHIRFLNGILRSRLKYCRRFFGRFSQPSFSVRLRVFSKHFSP
jgi:hypothetical protein